MTLKQSLTIKTLSLLLLFSVAGFSIFSQNENVKVIEQNLVASSWYLIFRNASGNLRDGTGDYVFRIYNENNTDGSGRDLRFAKKPNPAGGNGRWRIQEETNGNQTTYLLNIDFDNPSPITPDVALSFTIVNPFSSRYMHMVLRPPPEGNSNSITMKKH